jgi:hypothetical protein
LILGIRMIADKYMGLPKDPLFDQEWADDWAKIVDIFKTIDHLDRIFSSMESSVTELRALTQKKIIIELKKYAFSLSRYIAEKYRDN